MRKALLAFLGASLVFGLCTSAFGNPFPQPGGFPGKIYFRLTVDLPGKLKASTCKGDYMVRCGEEILAQGTVDLEDFSQPENRIFEYVIDLSGFRLSANQVMWRFRGEVYDAKLNQKFGPMVMQEEKLDETIEGIGYHISISDDGNIHTQKMVYRRQADPGRAQPAVYSNPFPPLDGPFSVGVRSYFWIDPDRKEIFTKDPNDRRHLFVQVWYPALVAPGMDKAPYILNPGAYGTPADLSRMIHLKTNSVMDAPLSGARPRFPVLLFSHGMHARLSCCTFLMEHLASHGYIIFSIGHTFFDGVEVFPDGYRAVQDFFPKMEEGRSQDERYQKFSEFLQRYTFGPLAEDTRFVLEQIKRMETDAGDFFHDRLDLDRMGICGWSVGGVNAVQMCHRDERLKAGINFDGTLNGVIARHGVGKPFMMMKSDPQIPENPDDEFKKMVSMIRRYESDFARHSKQLYRVIISGSRHTNFSDQPLYDASAAGRIDTKLCHEIIAKLAKAFFDRYVIGRTDGEWEKLADSYPAVSFKKY